MFCSAKAKQNATIRNVCMRYCYDYLVVVSHDHVAGTVGPGTGITVSGHRSRACVRAIRTDDYRSMLSRICIFACALLIAAQITNSVHAADSDNTNPLMTESTLPYHYPPFDKIKDEHFQPAIEAGMREQLKEIEPIANNSEKPTFDNTVVALERTGRLLDRAQRTFSNLNACDTNPTRQKIDTEIAPKLAAT